MPYPARRTTQAAIRTVRETGEQVAAVEICPDGRVIVRIGQPMTETETTGTPILDEIFKERGRTNGKANHDH